MTNKIILAFMLFGFGLFTVSCGNEAEEATQEEIENTPDIMDQLGLEDTNLMETDDLKIQVPESYISEKPENSMRLGQYAISEGSAVKLIVFKFPKNGDPAMGDMSDTKANADRWKADFVEPMNIDERTLSNDAYFFSADGTFKQKESMRSTEFEEVENYMSMAALLPTEKNVYTFKMVGPKEEVEKQKENFVKMLETAKVKVAEEAAAEAKSM
ncbi:MAG: hypothetical protein Kapaf2KO_08510 [Candidatus Kapaibacteriales bacterium]